MRMSILGFALGVWWLQRQGMLPEWPALAGLGGGILACAALAWAARRRWSGVSRIACFLGALLAGFAWAAAMGQLRLADHLPAQNEGRDIRVSGGVATVAQVPWIGGGCPGGRIVLHRQQQVAGLAGEIMGESMIVLGRHGRARYRSFGASWSRPILDLNGRVFGTLRRPPPAPSGAPAQERS